MQEFILFEPSLILSKEARSPEPYADLALATRAFIAALAIEISVFGLLVWLIQLWSARQMGRTEAVPSLIVRRSG